MLCIHRQNWLTGTWEEVRRVWDMPTARAYIAKEKARKCNKRAEYRVVTLDGAPILAS